MKGHIENVKFHIVIMEMCGIDNCAKLLICDIFSRFNELVVTLDWYDWPLGPFMGGFWLR